MTRKIHVHVSGPTGEGKSTIACIIRKALNEANIFNTTDASVANNNPERALEAPHDDVVVTISEGDTMAPGVLKEGLVKDASES